MAAEERLQEHKKNGMILHLLIGAAFVSFVTGIIGYAQFARYRMKEDDAREAFYSKLYNTAFFLLFLFGVIIMLYMAQYSD